MQTVIAYYRVIPTRSRAEQMKVQRPLVKQAVADSGAKIIETFTEKETEAHKTFPQLEKAIARCRETGATLLIAQVGRLWRSRSYTNILMDAGIEFIGLDNPQISSATIHIINALAEEQALKVSRRTKTILGKKKEEGVKLGSQRPGHWDGRDRQWGKCVKAASAARMSRTKEYYTFISPRIVQRRSEGASWATIARELNDDGLQTQRGKPFNGVQVYRLYQKAAKEGMA